MPCEQEPPVSTAQIWKNILHQFPYICENIETIETHILLKGVCEVRVDLEELSLKQLSLISYENYGVLYILFQIT